MRCRRMWSKFQVCGTGAAMPICAVIEPRRLTILEASGCLSHSFDWTVQQRDWLRALDRVTFGAALHRMSAPAAVCFRFR
jgi:hypothetical protein